MKYDVKVITTKANHRNVTHYFYALLSFNANNLLKAETPTG